MEEMQEIQFPPEAETIAIKLVAFDIMKQLCDEGKITKDELNHIAKKRGVDILVRKTA